MSSFMDTGTKNKTLPSRKKGTECWKRTLLEKGAVHIVDDDYETRAHQKRIMSIHRQKCAAIRKCFAEHTPYEVSSVPSGKGEQDFLDYWKETLRAKADDEVTVIYFHGDAGGNGDRFHMILKNQNYMINGYKFLELLCKSEKHVFVFMDCYFPGRFKDRQGLQRRSTCEAAFEIVACGAPGQDTEGNADVNPFTSAIVEHIEELVYKASNKKLYRKACFTLLELLGSRNPINKALDDNPTRFTTCNLGPEFKTVDGEAVEVEKVVPRLYFDPAYIRKNKKLAFQCDVVKDTKKAAKACAQVAGALAKPASKPASIVGDEGFDETMPED